MENNAMAFLSAFGGVVKVFLHSGVPRLGDEEEGRSGSGWGRCIYLVKLAEYEGS